MAKPSPKDAQRMLRANGAVPLAQKKNPKAEAFGSLAAGLEVS